MLVPLAIAEEQTLEEFVKESCAEDKEKFCNQVAPGEGRMLACAYAHEDKLSGKCSHALYLAAEALDQAINKLHHIAEACNNDIEAHCANVKEGNGRILSCLKHNIGDISPNCKTVMDQAGVM